MSEVIAAISQWLAAPLPLPRLLVALLVFVVLSNVLWVLLRTVNRRQEPELQRSPFRDLWIYYYIDETTTLPTVVDIRCRECNEEIVSSDAGRRGGPIRFLKCKKNHFVGSETKYADYARELEIERQKAELEWLEQKKQSDEALEKLKNRLETGEITQEEYRKIIAEAPVESRVGYYVAPDILPPTSIGEFLAQVAKDFTEEYKIARLDRVKTVPLTTPS